MWHPKQHGFRCFFRRIVHKPRTRFPIASVRALLLWAVVAGSAHPGVAANPLPTCWQGADLNGDGKINVVDVQCWLISSQAGSLDACLLTTMDINGDGSSSVVDLQRLLLFAVGAPLGANCDVDGDGCADPCAVNPPDGCAEFCSVSGKAGDVVYCPVRVAAACCCNQEYTKAATMNATLVYSGTKMAFSKLYYSCANSGPGCVPNPLPNFGSGDTWWWPGVVGDPPTLAITHSIMISQPSPSVDPKELKLVMFPGLQVPYSKWTFSTAKYDEWGKTSTNPDVFRIGFQLKQDINVSQPESVCVAHVSVQQVQTIPLTESFTNNDHVFVWGAYPDCPCPACGK